MRVRVPLEVVDVLSKREIEEVLEWVEKLYMLPTTGRVELATSLPPDVAKIVLLTLAALKPEVRSSFLAYPPLPKGEWVVFFNVEEVESLTDFIPQVREQESLLSSFEDRYLLNLPSDKEITVKVLSLKALPELWKAGLPYEDFKLAALFTWPIAFQEGHIQHYDLSSFPTNYLVIPEKWYELFQTFTFGEGAVGYSTGGNLQELEYYLSTTESQPYSDAVYEALYTDYSHGRLVEEEALLTLELKAMFSKIGKLPAKVAFELWHSAPKVKQVTYKLWNGWDILIFPSGLVVAGKLRSVEKVKAELQKVYKAYPQLLRTPIATNPNLPGVPIVGIPGTFLNYFRGILKEI